MLKRPFCWAYFRGSLFSEGLIIGRNFAFQTASTNNPWAYIWEGLLSEGFLRLRFGGLIFGRAYFWRGLFSDFLFGIWLILVVYNYGGDRDLPKVSPHIREGNRELKGPTSLGSCYFLVKTALMS